MKLNPPASSSDLEAARQIARRLHQQRRREDPGAGGWPQEETPLRPRMTPPPLPQRAEPPATLEPELPAAAHVRAEPPARPVPQPPSPPAFTPRPTHAPGPALPESELEEPEPSPFDEPAPAPAWRRPEVEAPEPAPLEALTDAPALPEVDVGTEEPALSPEEMVGEPDAEPSPLDQLTEPSPFGEELLDAPPVAEEPQPPAWDEIVESCRELGQAKGAMLVDPAGQVFSSRGDWPAPGPDAIAGKLVTMMAKTLKDAPTRSISAPLMGMHLTAWRIPTAEGLMTVAFIGPAPVRTDVRPAIDSSVLSGVGGPG